MAREVHRGAATVEGVEATLWRVINFFNQLGCGSVQQIFG